ncbi:MAG TPA: cytochrome c oxidase subunit 3 [Caulobacteraceae bacterium]|jgi:heme/copper-type cytochrome/quinol oxidase subunit 3|nr:cytochrome c oxidase subunit 3 [Caulobacteraceae bacterium]
MAETAIFDRPLPVGSKGRDSVGWWGVLCLIATEASLFAYLLFSYYYIGVQRGPAWLPEIHPKLTLSGPNTLILLSSSVAVWWGEEGIKHGRRAQHLTGIGIGIVLGTAFLIIQGFEWKAKTFGLNTSAYGSLFYTVTGFHMAHVFVGVAVLLVVWIWALIGYFSPRHHARVSVAAIYWHFVDVVWLFVFSTFYLSPYVLA